MSTDFQMPKLGLTMEEGTIIAWLVDDGAEVAQGAAILLIETDKTETEVEAPASGRLHQRGAIGAKFPCGQRIGIILADGEAEPEPEPEAAPAAAAAVVAPSQSAPSAAPAAAATSSRTSSGRLLASPNARRVATEMGVDVGSITGTGPGGRITSEDVQEQAANRSARPAPAFASAPPPAGSSGVPASVAARQLADLLGIALYDVPADPFERRVTRDGVAAYVRDQLAAAATPPAPTVAPAPASALTQTPTSMVRLSGMRGTIAKRMHASLQEMAQLTLTMDADVDAIVADRAERKAAGPPPGYTDYVIAAAARAFRDHPRVNAQITDDGIALLPEVHVGIAVALDEGLIVPVAHHTDQLGLAELGAETTRLATAAREGTLTPDDVAGGTFSVTALGMFSVDVFTPVINPPNVAILGVGRIREELAMVDGEVKAVQRMTLSLTWDHRAIDGAPAAEFTKSICNYLANPASLA